MKYFFFTIAALLLATPLLVLAQATYQPIVGVPLPGGQSADNLTAEQFVRVIYILAVSIAALLAVLKIIYGGVQYMLTDVVTSKDKARKDIWGAIFGLLIVLSAVFILEIINPQLTTLNLLRVERVEIAAPTRSAVAPAPPSAPSGNVTILGGSADIGNSVADTNNDFGLGATDGP